MPIPSVKECYQLLEKEKVPEHIIRHSEKVALVSVFLTSLLIEKEENLNPYLVLASSLLHDIKKIEGILTGKPHARLGGEFLRSLGYEEVAFVVERHVIFRPRKPYFTVKEEEIVFYADKRVKHETIVSLEERFEDLFKRYGKNEKSLARLKFLRNFSFFLERKIFNKIEEIKPIWLNNLNKIKDLRRLFDEFLKDSSSLWRTLYRERSFY